MPILPPSLAIVLFAAWVANAKNEPAVQGTAKSVFWHEMGIMGYNIEKFCGFVKGWVAVFGGKGGFEAKT
jgi:hypothetical protein